MEIIHFDIVEIIGLKNPKACIGSQMIVEDLPFPHKITRMNSCTSIPYKKILYHPLDTKCPPWHLKVNFGRTRP